MRAPTLLVKDIAVHTPATALANETITTCAKRMHAEHVGCLIVVEKDDGSQFPIGMLTDRDIAIEVVAFGLDPNALTAGDVMSEKPAVVEEDDDLLDVLARRAATVTLRADTAEERAALQRWSADAAATAPDGGRAVFEIGSARQARHAAPFDVCIDAPRPGELQAPVQVAAWLGRLRATLLPHGLLWCVVPYELLEQDGGAPPSRLRALLVAQGLECLTVAPLEADGRHVLVAHARVSKEGPA